jgi:hypothetical protein
VHKTENYEVLQTIVLPNAKSEPCQSFLQNVIKLKLFDTIILFGFKVQ